MATPPWVETPAQTAARTWRICILLFLATPVIYLGRQVMALTAERIIADFGLTKESFGRVIGAFRTS